MKMFLTRLFRHEKIESEQTVVSATADDPVKPDPEEFKGRPISEYLRARGVPEDTSRYEKERGVTTLYFRLGDLRPKPRSGSDEEEPDA